MSFQVIISTKTQNMLFALSYMQKSNQYDYNNRFLNIPLSLMVNKDYCMKLFSILWYWAYHRFHKYPFLYDHFSSFITCYDSMNLWPRIAEWTYLAAFATWSWRADICLYDLGTTDFFRTDATMLHSIVPNQNIFRRLYILDKQLYSRVCNKRIKWFVCDWKKFGMGHFLEGLQQNKSWRGRVQNFFLGLIKMAVNNRSCRSERREIQFGNFGRRQKCIMK